MAPYLCPVALLLLVSPLALPFTPPTPVVQPLPPLRSDAEHSAAALEALSELARVTRAENLVVNAPALLPNPPPSNAPAPAASPSSVRRNALSGLTVSLAMIPEAVGFACVAGVSPIVGLWTTVTMGLTAALTGGRGGIMTGASGAVAVVTAPLVARHGVAYLPATILLAGLIQVGAGLLKMGKWIRLVPHPVMLGFVNGLAIVMTKAQLTHFRSPAGGFLSLSSPAGATMAGLTALSILFMKVIPKVTKSLPPSLLTILLTTLAAKLLKLPARTLADIAGAETFRGGLAMLPKVALPSVPFSLATLKIILPVAATVAVVGLIESLLTLQLLDGIVDDGTRGSTWKECRGQGLGNVASALCGGMGGCALIGQSIMNVEAGGTKRLSGVAMALSLGVGIMAAAPMLSQIPIAALTGIMLLVCQSTFNWSSLRLLGKIPRLDAAVIFLVSYITVVEDLAVATLAGTVLSALSFAWKQSTVVSVLKEGGTYKLSGPIFFASTGTFARLFSPKDLLEEAVTLDFTNARV
ncbi:hypothetical protein TeGR_g7817, partial [Tetraparma gracilis]